MFDIVFVSYLCFLVTGRTALKRYFDAVAVHIYLPVTAALHAAVSLITDYARCAVSVCACAFSSQLNYTNMTACAYLEAHAVTL